MYFYILFLQSSQIEKNKSIEDRPLNNISLNFFSILYEKQYLVGKSNILSTKVGLGYFLFLLVLEFSS